METKSLTAHDETTEGGKTVWVYTFDVPDDAAEWDVYEVIPNAYDGLYSVSASYNNNKSGDARITSPESGSMPPVSIRVNSLSSQLAWA